MILKSKNSGFTMIEILIITIIIGILAVIVMRSTSSQISYYELQKTTNGFISLLEKARSRAFNSYNDTQHSIKIESNQAILFEGTTYSSSDPDNEIYSYDNGISLDATSLQGGVTTINFEKVSGATSDYGSVRFAITGASTSSSTVYISEAGVIYSQ
jgi:type II secretory pathway pseudopilin PulG